MTCRSKVLLILGELLKELLEEFRKKRKRKKRKEKRNKGTKQHLGAPLQNERDRGQEPLWQREELCPAGRPGSQTRRVEGADRQEAAGVQRGGQG